MELLGGRVLLLSPLWKPSTEMEAEEGLPPARGGHLLQLAEEVVGIVGEGLEAIAGDGLGGAAGGGAEGCHLIVGGYVDLGLDLLGTKDEIQLSGVRRGKGEIAPGESGRDGQKMMRTGGDARKAEPAVGAAYRTLMAVQGEGRAGYDRERAIPDDAGESGAPAIRLGQGVRGSRAPQGMRRQEAS